MQRRTRPVLPALQGTVRIASEYLKLFHLLTLALQLTVRKTVLSRLLFIQRYYKIMHGFLLQYLEKSLYSLVYEQGSGFI
jgi:hypothetical protein